MRKWINKLPIAVCLLLLVIGFSLSASAQDVVDETSTPVVATPPSPEMILRQKVERNPRDVDSIQKLLLIYQQSGRLRTANRFLLQVLNQNPELSVSFMKRGVNNSLAAKDYERTVQFARFVNTKEPQNADNLNSMGFALYNLKQYGVARAAFEMSVYLDPQNYRSLTNLARDLVAMGDITKAREFYQKALAINPNYQLAKRNLAKLDGGSTQHRTRTPSVKPPERAQEIEPAKPTPAVVVAETLVSPEETPPLAEAVSKPSSDSDNMSNRQENVSPEEKKGAEEDLGPQE